jgi:hypothetical protein
MEMTNKKMTMILAISCSARMEIINAGKQKGL